LTILEDFLSRTCAVLFDEFDRLPHLMSEPERERLQVSVTTGPTISILATRPINSLVPILCRSSSKQARLALQSLTARTSLINYCNGLRVDLPAAMMATPYRTWTGRWPAGPVSGDARAFLGDMYLWAALYSQSRRHQLCHVRMTREGTMTYGGKTDGRKCGTRSQRTPNRRLRAEPVENVTSMNALQRLRYASDYLFTLAERERKKGDRADVTFVANMMRDGALLAAKAAPYVRPKLAAMRFDSEPQRQVLDLEKLTVEELMALERMMVKAQTSVPDESTPRTADEYLASTKPIVEGESKGDAHNSVVAELADKVTNDQLDLKG
jgi:hypothetical protein